MLKIGHRGACGHAPENTLASIKKALDFGVDAVEFDIQMSKDGVPVIIHDETLERTTNGKGLVSDFTLSELQKLDAGNGEKIPSLFEVIKFVDKKAALLIELKAKNAAKAVAEIIADAVENLGWNYEQLTVISFNHPQLVEIKKLNPRIITGALLVAIPVKLAEIAQDAGASIISLGFDYCSKELINDAHKRGLKTLVWTVNSKEKIEQARSMKVDGIISNYPDILIST